MSKTYTRCTSIPPSFGAIAHLVGHSNTTWGKSNKLKAEDVSEIKRLYASEEVKYDELARRFGVSVANISSIILGKSWKGIK